MQNEPINTSPINSFINQVKAADLSNQREIKMDLKTAKLLSFCLTQVLARNVQDYENWLKTVSKAESEVVIQMDGGNL